MLTPAKPLALAKTRVRHWIVWFGVLVLVTAAMLPMRGHIDKAHITLVFLLVVLGASAAGGRMLGLAIVAAAFLTFNFFFLPPYATLVIANPLDWLVLVAFAAVSAVAAQLLHRARREAQEAQARASEIDRLAVLGAETLNAPDAHDGLQAIVEVIRTTLEVSECDVFEREGDEARLVATSRAGAGDEPLQVPQPDAGALVGWIVSTGRRAAELSDGTVRVSDESPLPGEPRALALPLRVRGTVVGVLRVAGDRLQRPSAEWRRMLDALAYYAALGVERVRLTAIAERAEGERRLEALRSALLTSVSHDLRTPLTSIKGLAHEIAQTGNIQIASEIESEVDRLNTLIGDMLELSRIHSGAVHPVLAVNTVDELIGAALQQARSVLAGRSVEVDTPRDAMLMGRFAFTESLRVMVNLLENAAKYTPGDSPIVIRARRDGADLTIAVLDRGPGVPPVERERIFEPFYRPAGIPSDARGTGLGLSIARGLAEAQGGVLRYESRDGGGSVFVLGLPAADAPDLTS